MRGASSSPESSDEIAEMRSPAVSGPPEAGDLTGSGVEALGFSMREIAGWGDGKLRGFRRREVGVSKKSRSPNNLEQTAATQ